MEEAINDLCALLSTEEINPVNIVSLLARSMVLVAGYQDLTGQEKKEVVLRSLKAIVEKAVPGDQPYLESFINYSASLAIETLCEVDKRHLKFRKSACPFLCKK